MLVHERINTLSGAVPMLGFLFVRRRSREPIDEADRDVVRAAYDALSGSLTGPQRTRCPADALVDGMGLKPRHALTQSASRRPAPRARRCSSRSSCWVAIGRWAVCGRPWHGGGAGDARPPRFLPPHPGGGRAGVWRPSDAADSGFVAIGVVIATFVFAVVTR
jgi:hypothetical protein